MSVVGLVPEPDEDGSWGVIFGVRDDPEYVLRQGLVNICNWFSNVDKERGYERLVGATFMTPVVGSDKSDRYKLPL